MKKKCKTCNHKCHCYGQGYNLHTDKCEKCICDNCTCNYLVLKSEPKKLSLWQRYVNWLFKDYNNEAM